MAIKFLSTVAVDTNVLYVDAAANKVGIGTASPSAKLQVTGTSGYVLKTNGDIALTTYTGDTKIDMANNSLQLLSPSGNVQIGDTEFDGNGTSIQVDDANSKVVIAGNVGIGTSTPGKLLEVKSSIAYNSTVRLSTTAHNWDIQGGETGYSSTAFALDYDGTTFFRAMGTTDARFSGGLSVGTINATPPTGGLYVAGNVGIGTTSPGEKLDVAGSVKTTGTVKFYNSTSHYGSIYADSEGLNLDTVANRHMIFKKANVEVMRISTSGNVGIGTTSPTAKLHIQHSGGAGSGLYVKSNVNRSKITVADNDSAAYVIAEGGKASYGTADSLSANNLTIETSGNVGIGTTSPASKLEIRDSIDTVLRVVKTGISVLDLKVTTGSSDISSSNSNDLTFTTGGSERFRITSGGNVGIGTTSPVEKLEVLGYIKSSVGFKANTYTSLLESSNDTVISNSAYYNMLFKTNNAERMRITNAGNVGIGTTSPSAALEVVGGIKLSDNSPLTWATSNTRIFGQSGYMQLQVAGGDVMRLTSAGDVGIGVITPRAKLDVNGGVKVADDTDTASANKVGTLRYRYVPGSPKNFSYVDMCMQTGASSYAWVNIVQNVWN